MLAAGFIFSQMKDVVRLQPSDWAPQIYLLFTPIIDDKTLVKITALAMCAQEKCPLYFWIAMMGQASSRAVSVSKSSLSRAYTCSVQEALWCVLGHAGY